MEIIIRPRMIERAAFSLIILALVALVVFLYLRSPTCPAVSANAGADIQAPPGTTVPDPTPNVSTTVTPPAATCSDGSKNQDESDIDCGGLACSTCSEGLACAKNADCLKGRCDATKHCNATLPSVATEFTIVNVNYNGDRTTTADISGVAIVVKNGKTTPGNFRIDFYVKSSDDKYYLNQGGKDLVSEPHTAYAKITLPAIAAGESLTQLVSLTGMYTGVKGLVPTIAADNGYTYSAGQDFIVEGRLIDATTDAVLVTAKKKVLIK